MHQLDHHGGVQMTLPFQRVTVLGAGTMGHGIAHVCAMAGLETVLYEDDPSDEP